MPEPPGLAKVELYKAPPPPEPPFMYAGMAATLPDSPPPPPLATKLPVAAPEEVAIKTELEPTELYVPPAPTVIQS
jgi:hypothetical protein